MEDIAAMLRTFSQVARESKPLKAALTGGALGLAVLVAVLAALQAAPSATTQTAEPDQAESGQAGEGTSAEDGGTSSSSSPAAPAQEASTTPAEAATVTDVLEGYDWADTQTGSAYSFSGGQLTHPSGQQVPYSVSDVQASAPETSEYDDDSDGHRITATTTSYSFVFDLNGAATASTLSLTTYDDGGTPTATFTTSALAHPLSAAAKGAAVAVVDSYSTGQVAEALGMDQGTFEDELGKWCESNAVGTTQASWDGKTSTNWGTGARTLELKLNNSTHMTVTCLISADGSVSFKRG